MSRQVRGVALARRQVVGPPRRTTLVEGVRGCARAAGHSKLEVPTVDDGMASLGRDSAQTVLCAPFVLGVAPGAIVAGFDVHRRQITFDALDTVSGECWRGQLESTSAAVERWVGRFPGRVVHVAVEACTGWLFVCRALEYCGAVAHLAEPVETSALRGRKRRAKTDRADAKWLRQLLCEGRLPESWCPPEHVRQWRSRARLRNTLLAERTSWIQRIRATLYHHGVAGAPDELRTRRPPVPRRSGAARRRPRANRRRSGNHRSAGRSARRARRPSRACRIVGRFCRPNSMEPSCTSTASNASKSSTSSAPFTRLETPSGRRSGNTEPCAWFSTLTTGWRRQRRPAEAGARRRVKLLHAGHAIRRAIIPGSGFPRGPAQRKSRSSVRIACRRDEAPARVVERASSCRSPHGR